MVLLFWVGEMCSLVGLLVNIIVGMFSFGIVNVDLVVFGIFLELFMLLSWKLVLVSKWVFCLSDNNEIRFFVWFVIFSVGFL